MRLRNRKQELEKEKLELELSIDLSMGMVYDNRFDTSIALSKCSDEFYKDIVDAYVNNEEFLKSEVFDKMCRIYKINTQLEFLKNIGSK